MHTGPTYNPRGCAYRLRDIPDWRTLQEVVLSIPEEWKAGCSATTGRQPASGCRVVGQGLVDAIEQGAYLLAGGVGVLIQALLLVQ